MKVIWKGRTGEVMGPPLGPGGIAPWPGSSKSSPQSESASLVTQEQLDEEMEDGKFWRARMEHQNRQFAEQAKRRINGEPAEKPSEGTTLSAK